MDELLAELAATHELTIELSDAPDGLVVAISTCSCVRWGNRASAPARDRQLLLSALTRVHADHEVGAA